MSTLTFRYRFYMQIIIRVLLITLNCLLFAFTWAGTDQFFTLINLGALIVLQVILLIYFLNKINRDIMQFLASIRSEDANLTFARKWRSFNDLYGHMEEISGKIQTLRSEYAAQVRYFRTVVEHVQTGLISFGRDGNVDLMNRAAKRLLGIKTALDLDHLRYGDGTMRTFLINLVPSQHKLVRLTSGMEQVVLSLHSTILGMEGERLKIISFHNIGNELNEHESESWQRLIRVLNHEIMNSVAPVLSTIGTLSGYFAQGSENPILSGGTVNEAIYRKTVTGLDLIQERSEGLRQFVNKYKNLYEIGEPEYKLFRLNDLFDSCHMLMLESIEKEGVVLTIVMARHDLQIVADRKFLQQVLVNLIKNSIESLSGSVVKHRTIELSAFKNDQNKNIIQVTDNGPGIPHEIIDQVFIPFYTTKPNGSGIGLSLSRMILTRMGWSLHLTSIPFERTTFTLSN